MALPPIQVIIDGTTAGLEEALQRSQRLLGNMQGATDRAADRLRAFGGAADSLGRRMLPVSGGIAAMGAAAAAMVNRTTQAANEMRRFAQVSGTTTDEFQRLSAAAETVGFDGQGLADVFQDMNDRVGDFVQTGGGPMADFFEQIAPQVGITADAFRDLSGPDALQLYVDSLEQAGVNQQDMAFFMEALSSNTTRLLPLLQNGGAEMQRLGDAAEATGQIMSAETIAASQELSESMLELRGNFSGAAQRITSEMIPVFNTLVGALNEHVIPAIQNIADGIGNAIEWFGNLPEPVQEAAAMIATALGVGGPVLIAIGAVSTALGALVAATGPIGLLIAAAALAYAAWQRWGDDIIALFETVRQGISDGVQRIQDRIQQMVDWFAALPERFREFGRNIIQGLLDGINEVWESLRARIMELGELLPNWLRERLGIASPSRVMHEIGTFIGQGLSNGIQETAGLAQQAMGVMASGVEQTAMNTAQQVVGALGQMFQGSRPIAAAQALINTFLGMTEALRLPFPASLGAAAQVLATGMSAVQSIRSASPGSASSGGGASAMASGGAAAMPTQNIMLDFGGTASGGQINQMQSFADTFNEAIRQGVLPNVMVSA
jgi:hypothetical protein